MATGTNGIATIGDLIYGKGLSAPPAPYDGNKCPIAYEVSTTMGGSTGGGYQANQLVKYSDVSKITIEYVIEITTSIDYSSLALFPNTSTIPNPAYNYTLLRRVAQGVKTYIIRFNHGSGLSVNDPAYPNNPITIYIGSQYRVWGKVNSGSPWTYVATLTHVNSSSSYLI